MKRRMLLLALGGGSAVGTGAVSEIGAEREVSINVSADSNAFVQLEPISDKTLDNFVTTEAGEVTLTISNLSGAPGEGVNTEAVTALDDLIKLTNPGPNPLSVRFEQFEAAGITAEFYTGNAAAPNPRATTGVTIRTSAENAVSLNVGESRNIGLLIDTAAVESAKEGVDSVIITAGVIVDGG